MLNVFKKKEPLIHLKKGDMVFLKDGRWDGEDCGFSFPVAFTNHNSTDVSLKTNEAYTVFFVGEDPSHIFIEFGNMVMRIQEWQIDIEKTIAEREK